MRIILVLLLGLLYSAAFAQQNIIIPKEEKQILKDYPKLETVLFQYLDYSSCSKTKSQDFINLYSILSNEYLNKQFPNVKTAQDYKDHMIDRSEIYHLVYLSIEKIKLINRNIAEITLIFESGNEGVIQKMEETIYFKLEDKKWKYNGINLKSLKVLETIK